jgi:hypothetical protein
VWEVLRDGGGERGERQRIAARLRLRSDDGEPVQKPAALRVQGDRPLVFLLANLSKLNIVYLNLFNASF